MNNLNYQKSFVNVVNYNGFWGPQGQCARTMSRQGGLCDDHGQDKEEQLKEQLQPCDLEKENESYDEQMRNYHHHHHHNNFDTVTMNLSEREASTFSLVIEAPEDSVRFLRANRKGRARSEYHGIAFFRF